MIKVLFISFLISFNVYSSFRRPGISKVSEGFINLTILNDKLQDPLKLNNILKGDKSLVEFEVKNSGNRTAYLKRLKLKNDNTDSKVIGNCLKKISPGKVCKIKLALEWTNKGLSRSFLSLEYTQKDRLIESVIGAQVYSLVQ